MYVPHIGTLYPVLVNTDASCDSNNLVYSQQDRINMDDFAMGTNAIVAVISYTVSNNLHLSFLARSGFNYIQLGIRYGRCNGHQSGFTSAWICSRSGLYFENYRLERT